MQEPPPPPTAPRPAGTPVTSEVVYESELVDRIDRARFWANFGAVAAVLAAIIGVIALIVAIGNNDNSSNARSTADLRREITQLRGDVASLKSQTSSASDTKSQ